MAQLIEPERSQQRGFRKGVPILPQDPYQKAVARFWAKFIDDKVLMNIIATRGVLEQGACLDALISIMLDSSDNQMDFEKCNGIEEVALLIGDKQVDENLRRFHG